MMPPRLIFRQLAQSPRQAALVAACAALAIAAVVALNGFGASIGDALDRDSRRLQAADIVVRTHQPLTMGLDSAIAGMTRSGRVKRANLVEMYSVIRTADGTRSLLANLKLVEAGYPFYGEVQTGSRRPFADVLSPGRIVVAPDILSRLQVTVGDRLHIGRAELVIADTVTTEPDRPVTVFSLGPRVLLSMKDLQALALVQTGSRVHYTTLLKVTDGSDPSTVATALQSDAGNEEERVDTFNTAPSRIRRFVDNFRFFLDLMGAFLLVMAGIGIQATLTAFLRSRYDTVAIMRALGAGTRFILGQFVAVTGILALAGTVAGMALGALLQWALLALLGPFLPSDLGFSVSWSGMASAVAMGWIMAALFAVIPLARLLQCRPQAIFHKTADLAPPGWLSVASILAVAGLFSAMVLHQISDMAFGLYYIAGTLAGMAVVSGLAQLLLWRLKQANFKGLVARQAARGLFRPGNATRSIVICLAAAMTVIYTIWLVEKNLDQTYVRSYPPDAPNLFFIDIQRDQAAAVKQILGPDTRLYPIVRARVVRINDRAIDRRAERRKKRDNLARVFNLTYRTDLLEDERIIDGSRLFDSNAAGTQVSVLDTVVDMHPMAIGDTITFNIQGVPLTARISSIRKRTQESFSPYFYFVFEPRTLQRAPQTLFTAARVPGDQVAAVQTRVVERFPNISVLDASATVARFTHLMARLTRIIRLCAQAGLVAGALMVAATILATRHQRITETVYYKILGARRRLILQVFTLENLLIGATSAAIAIAIAQAASYLICTRMLQIDYNAHPGPGFAMATATAAMVVLVGHLASRSILKHRPITYLRESADG